MEPTATSTPKIAAPKIAGAAPETCLRTGPPLPPARGQLSGLVRDMLVHRPPDLIGPEESGLIEAAAQEASEVDRPLADDDLQLALYLLYQLHYRSFSGIDEGWEWNPLSVGVRGSIEAAVEGALDDTVSVPEVEPEDVGEALFDLERQADGPSLAGYLENKGSLDEFREFAMHRSAYQLKRADPHSWAIPRLAGPPKSALVEVQFDEYGSGRPERMYSGLFARTMREIGLDPNEDAHLNRLPGSTLATVNLVSGFGLNRRNRGKIVGHLAMFEMTSSRPDRGYGDALRRLGFGPEATEFFDEHAKAGAAHENSAAYDMAGSLALSEPKLAADIMFGAAALLRLEGDFARALLQAWEEGRSSLLPVPPGNVAT